MHLGGIPNDGNGGNDKRVGHRITGSYRSRVFILLLLFILLAIGLLSGYESVAAIPKSADTWTITLPLRYSLHSIEGTSVFQQAYDTSYSALIQEMSKSCNRSKVVSLLNNEKACLVRKRVDFSTWPLKAEGGLSDMDRQYLADLYYKSESAFEFGVGESTDIASATNLPRYVGVDSSGEWITAVRLRSPTRFRFYLADIGETGPWGFPKQKPTTAKMKFHYQIAPLFLERNPFDVYLVDGRFRVACVMACFLHAISTGADFNKTRILLHDFAWRQEHYGVVKTVANVERQLENGLLVLVKKPNATPADYYALYERFAGNVW